MIYIEVSMLKVLVGMNHDIQLTIINLLNEIIADNPKKI